MKAENKKIRFQVDMDTNEYDELVKSVNSLFELTVAGKTINPIPSHIIEPIVRFKNLMTAALQG
nr:MAG TPA: hypothetical protein [Caudoviricetes sp.]